MVWSRFRTSALLVSGMALAVPAVGASSVQAFGDAADTVSVGQAAPEKPRVSFREWTSTPDFAHGKHEGTRPAKDALTIVRPVGKTEYKDPFGEGGAKSWDYARWTSGQHRIGFGASELIASWTADTPKDTWVQVEMRGKTTEGAETQWYVMGRWSTDDPKSGGAIHRTSVPKQEDAHGKIYTDTFVAKDGHELGSYQLRTTLYRKPGTKASPAVRATGAMASWLPKRDTVPVSPGGEAWGIDLKLPKKSQSIHRGHYPQWGGGGQVWCSPTSTSMVLGYWKRGPSGKDMDWIPAGHTNPEVDYAARNTFDYEYDGAGNWPFNTAYAGRYGMNGFVTRLRTVTELEKFIKAGIPVVTSQSFKEEELPGAGYGTDGHLFVIGGFSEKGDPIVYDPASPSNDKVRRVYPRKNFENVWLRSKSSGGVVYIMTPPGKQLPPNVPGLDKNW